MEGLEEGRTQSPVEAVAMEVDGGVVEPLLGAYADLPLSPLPPEEDLLVLLGDKPAATEQNPSLPLQGTEQEGQPSLGDFSWWEVSAFDDSSEWGEPVARALCGAQSAEPGFQGEPQQSASGSLEEVPDVAPRDEEAGSAQPQGASSGVRHQNALGTVDFGKCPYPSCRFERQGNKCSKMVDHALSSHLPWYVRGDVTCLQCKVPFVSAPQLEQHLQDAHGCRSEEHVQEYMDLMEDLLLFLARHLSHWNPTLEGLPLRARRLQRSGAISIPLNCSSNLLWVRFLERFGLPVPEVFSMESLNSIVCLLHWRVLLALGACLPGKLKAEFRALGVREGKPGVKQASASGQSCGKARPTKQSQVTARQGKGIPEAALLLCTTAWTVWLTHISISTRWPETLLSRPRSDGRQPRYGEGCSWPPGHGALHHPSRGCSWQLHGGRGRESAEDTLSGPEGGNVFRWAPFHGLSVGSGDKG